LGFKSPNEFDSLLGCPVPAFMDELRNMARPKPRVLLDLSMACRGYCGIAQDVRLLYKTLATCGDVEVTGLIYPPRKLPEWHRFCSPRKSRADRVANQSVFLWKLADPGLDWRSFQSWRGLKHLPDLARTVLGSGGQCELLDAASFRDVIWRMLFSPTLAAEDRALVAEGKFLLSNLSDGMVFARGLTRRRPLKLDTRGYDFLIVAGPRPFRASRGTRQIVRYHDMIPLLDPDTMRNPWVIHWHHRAIRQCHSSVFVCNSRPTQDKLAAIYPRLAEQCATIPYALSDAYYRDPNPGQVGSIVRMRRSQAAGAPPPDGAGRTPRYLICVSTLEPRKNFVRLIEAFNMVRCQPAVRERVGRLKLVIVGSPGWKYEPILAAMREGIARGDVIHLERVSAPELRLLYTHAEAFILPSLAEGFGFPPLEAMQCDTPVIVSDIKEHRWVMGDAAVYCNPYDVASIAAAIERLVAGGETPALGPALIERGRRLVERYSIERCARQWRELLAGLHCGKPVASCPGAGPFETTASPRAA
jgi:hypothetical protein